MHARVDELREFMKFTCCHFEQEVLYFKVGVTPEFSAQSSWVAISQLDEYKATCYLTFIRQVVTMKHQLLAGEVLDLPEMAASESEYLRKLAEDASRGDDYFALLWRVKGRGALPVGNGPITPTIAGSALFRVAHDIVDRVGIKQGYLLDPHVQRPTDLGVNDDLLSLTETAELIGITRPATHEALGKGRLKGRRVGNAWVIRRADAEAFKNARERHETEGHGKTAREVRLR